MKFRIRWRNPETKAYEAETKEFRSKNGVSARDIAEDYADRKADGGWSHVEVERSKDNA